MLLTMFATRRTICSLSSRLQTAKNRTNILRCVGSYSAIENCVDFHNTLQYRRYLLCNSIYNRKSCNLRLLKWGGKMYVFSRTYSSALFTSSVEGEQAAFILKPEINFEILRSRMVDVENSVKYRNMDVNQKEVLTMWEDIQELERQKVQFQLDKKNVKFSNKDKISDEEKKKAKERGKALREQIRIVNSRISELTDQLYPMALKIPNLMHKDVPLHGKPVELESFTGHGGDLKTIKVGRRESHELVHPGFMYLEDEGALLEQALLVWASHQLNKKGFTRYSSPDKYKPIAMEAVGLDLDGENQLTFLNKGQNKEITYYNNANKSKIITCEARNEIFEIKTYTAKTQDEISYLAGSGPMAFAAYFMMTVVEANYLPQRCYTVGRHYNSLHDNGKFEGFHKSFQKNTVEVCGLCEESTATSDIIFNQYVSILKELYSELPVKCRLVEVPSSQLLPSMYHKCALEVWLPKTEEYVEAACVYSCTDYISRRLKIRHLMEGEKSSDHKHNRKFVHTIHGQFLDTGVLIEALHQLAENRGELCIPSVILSYMPKSAALKSSAR